MLTDGESLMTLAGLRPDAPGAVLEPPEMASRPVICRLVEFSGISVMSFSSTVCLKEGSSVWRARPSEWTSIFVFVWPTLRVGLMAILLPISRTMLVCS